MEVVYMTSALFLNGVYEGVLEEILQVQAHLPEQIMFLQPHKGEAITICATSLRLSMVRCSF
jgi:hypothetical protein